MSPVKRIVIVAGEESGDLHAAAFINQLKADHSSWQFSGVGGRHMERAGVHLISDLARYGVTGISEVIRHIGVIRKTFNALKAHLTNNKPDLLILVDYPGFNLRLAKFAKKKLGIRILYYISPQIWAWKAGRIDTIRQCVDQMAVIFPFEKTLYQKAGVPAAFVGHPLVDKIATCNLNPVTRNHLNLPQDKRMIAMLPGSRAHEIERHMPVLIESAVLLCQQRSDLHFVIPVAGTVNPDTIRSYFSKTTIPYTLIEGNTLNTIRCSDCVVVASGTASLECALLEKPMCIIYKTSLLTYIAAFKLIRVKYLGLCNLLQNEMIAPELLQYDCNATELSRTILDLLSPTGSAKPMQLKLEKLHRSLSSQQADCSIHALIERLISQ